MSDEQLVQRLHLLREHREAAKALNSFHLRELQKLRREVEHKQETLRLNEVADRDTSERYDLAWLEDNEEDRGKVRGQATGVTPERLKKYQGAMVTPYYSQVSSEPYPHGHTYSTGRSQPHRSVYEVTKAITRRNNV